jgi:hypothetical protein
MKIEIRVNTGCSLGFNPKTKKTVCEFCHESARTDGKECDYEKLKDNLKDLPAGTELVIGGNKLTDNLTKFLVWSKNKGFICNLIVNHLHINLNDFKLKFYLEEGLINGLGISYRRDYPINFDDYFYTHPNVVLHVIAGIDDVDDILELPFQKILCLGYKVFGFGVDFYTEEVRSCLQRWTWFVKKLMDKKNLVSFDNLALEQLNIERFLTKEHRDIFNQGEHNMYVNAVSGYFAPSSRSHDKVNWKTTTVGEYFKQIEEQRRLELV